MPMFHGVPLSDDEYDERLVEAQSRAAFAYADFCGSKIHLIRTWNSYAETFTELGNTMNALVSQGEAALTPDERARYEALRAAGVLPLDALAALEEGPDSEIVALMEVDDEDE